MASPKSARTDTSCAGARRGLFLCTVARPTHHQPLARGPIVKISKVNTIPFAIPYRKP
jgi:hypothetical protein